MLPENGYSFKNLNSIKKKKKTLNNIYVCCIQKPNKYCCTTVSVTRCEKIEGLVFSTVGEVI